MEVQVVLGLLLLVGGMSLLFDKRYGESLGLVAITLEGLSRFIDGFFTGKIFELVLFLMAAILTVEILKRKNFNQEKMSEALVKGIIASLLSFFAVSALLGVYITIIVSVGPTSKLNSLKTSARFLAGTFTFFSALTASYLDLESLPYL